MLKSLSIIDDEKGDIAKIKYQTNHSLPAVQGTLFSGEHKERQHYTGDNHRTDIDIIFGLKRQRLNSGADAEHEKDIENI